MTNTKDVKIVIGNYLQDIAKINSESAISHRFCLLLGELLGFQPELIRKFVSGIETYIKIKDEDIIIKGRVDNLFGNIIIEFKKNLTINLEDAKEQLKQYTAIFWNQENPDNRTPFICIATDGILFYNFTPALDTPKSELIKPENVILNVFEKSAWSKQYLENPNYIYYWLDRYFLRKEILKPTSDSFIKDFGIDSHALKTISQKLLALWNQLKLRSDYDVIYENWDKYLRIVYGSSVANDELFINHTYLATLAKLIAWIRLSEHKENPTFDQVKNILNGDYFINECGIENLIEEDFYTWIIRSDSNKIALEISKLLFSLLKNYDLRQLTEDILKSLYQELVDPSTRHDLGEYYTPDWLAHKVVNKFMDQNPEGRFLDPTCGSGTFLYLTILEKRKRLGEKIENLLEHILDSVCGIDIHPLAVIIAKVNYILALSELFDKRKENISIPIYLADSINLPEKWIKTEDAEYIITINGLTVHLPGQLLKDFKLGDKVIETAKEYAQQNLTNEISYSGFRNFYSTKDLPFKDSKRFIYPLFTFAETLKILMERKRDSIWAYVIKNAYKPLFFIKRFDFIVGNPPWVVFRTLNPEYQKV
jgi:hypothetical protein